MAMLFHVLVLGLWIQFTDSGEEKLRKIFKTILQIDDGELSRLRDPGTRDGGIEDKGIDEERRRADDEGAAPDDGADGVKDREGAGAEGGLEGAAAEDGEEGVKDADGGHIDDNGTHNSTFIEDKDKGLDPPAAEDTTPTTEDTTPTTDDTTPARNSTTSDTPPTTDGGTEEDASNRHTDDGDKSGGVGSKDDPVVFS